MIYVLILQLQQRGAQIFLMWVTPGQHLGCCRSVWYLFRALVPTKVMILNFLPCKNCALNTDLCVASQGLAWYAARECWWLTADGLWLMVDGWLLMADWLLACVVLMLEWLQGRASKRTLSVTWRWRSVSSPTPWWWLLAGTPCCWVGGVQGGSENYHNATRDQAIFWTIYISTFLFKNTVCIQVFPILNSTLKAISCYNSATRIILVHSVFFFVKFLIPVFNIFCLIVPTSIV